jgi:hypothetical protein
MLKHFLGKIILMYLMESIVSETYSARRKPLASLLKDIISKNVASPKKKLNNSC